MSAPRLVRNFHIQTKTGLFGKTTRKASFDCPHCNAKLVAGKDEIGKADTCPSCGGEFILAKEAAENIRRLNELDDADAKRRASAAEYQRKEAEAASRRQQEEEAARRSQQMEESEDMRRQRNAALQLVGAKESFRNYDIRQYPALESMAIIFIVLMWCVIVVEILFIALNVFMAVYDIYGSIRIFPAQILVILMSLLPAAVAAFLLKLVSELIRLFINMAQDNERIVRLSEAQMGKPWAPK